MKITLIYIVSILFLFSSCKKYEIEGNQDGSDSLSNNPNTFTDMRDGKIYKTVTIGTQTWMAENLQTTTYQNGDQIPNVNDATWPDITNGAYCWYNNDITNKDTYGPLYNWFAVADSRKIAPQGWHVPTETEWTTLATFLGGESTSGGKMKEVGTMHWFNPNTGADNSCGFTALPGGICTGTFSGLGYDGYWWSSTEINSGTADLLYLEYNSSIILSHINTLKAVGLSIRCVRD